MKVTLLVLFCFITLYVSATQIIIPIDIPTIQAGINQAVVGDTVLVLPGTYLENINFNGKNITVTSLFLSSQDPVFIEETIIDGNANSSVVKFNSLEDSTAVLCGFTITNGLNYRGGGIFCSGASPTMMNLIVSDNDLSGTESSYGGGIYCNDSSARLLDLVVTENSIIGGTRIYGAGIFLDDSPAYLSNIVISNNSANGASWNIGGGIYIDDSAAILDRLLIINNSVTNGNWCRGAGASIRNCSPTLNHVTISDNYAEDGEIVNTGSVDCGSDGHPVFNNSIIWHNAPSEIIGIPVTNYSCVHLGWNGTEILEATPQFVDHGNGDYHLSENSPCIDAGDPNSPLDPDGTRADMGFYYYNQQTDHSGTDIPTNHVSLSNYPNPFNPTGAGRGPSTTIEFSSVKELTNPKLEIFNTKGQLVKQFSQLDGTSVTWNGKDSNNQPVSAGIYFYRLTSVETVITRKMVMMK